MKGLFIVSFFAKKVIARFVITRVVGVRLDDLYLHVVR